MSKKGRFLGMPFDWRQITSQRLKSHIWNKNDHRLFTPKVFGWGYCINFYELLYRRKKLFIILSVIVITLAGFAIQQGIELDRAHSTFENYYAFRGCNQLIQKTDTSAVCKTNGGETIKIVKYHDKWYLDGDLPCGFLCF